MTPSPMTLRVTEARVELPVARSDPDFLAYAAITLEGSLVIRGLRLIRMAGGRILVAMPNCKRSRPCPACLAIVPVDHDWCGRCGRELPWADEGARPPLDAVFPCHRAQRAEIEAAVLREYDIETSRAAVREWEDLRAAVRTVA